MGPAGPQGDPGPAGAAGGVTTSGQRLRARYMAGADNSKEFLGWFDSQRNEPCFFTLAGDGVMRCLPDGTAFSNQFFMDAGCTQRLAFAFKGACTTPPSYSKVFHPNDPATCAPGGSSVHSVGAQLGPQTVYSQGSPGCVEIPAADWTSQYDLYVLGAEIAPAAFVAGNTTIE